MNRILYWQEWERLAAKVARAERDNDLKDGEKINFILARLRSDTHKIHIHWCEKKLT